LFLGLISASNSFDKIPKMVKPRFSGCGKIHFGKLLAQKMHRRFIGTDELIAQLFAKQTGQHTAVREIYVQLGPQAFRALEKVALHSLKNEKNAVLAALQSLLVLQDPPNGF